MEWLDDLDLKLLDLLQADASRSNQDIAATAGVSPATTLRRVRRLVDGGVIERKIAIVAPQAGNKASFVFSFDPLSAASRR